MREIKNEYLYMSKNEYLHENNQNLNKNGSMATMAEKMAASLEELRKLQEKDRCVVLQGTAEIGRTHLTRLLDNGWLQEVMKGWYIAARPGTEGDTTRPMVLTRKNMLFCGNQQAAENTAVICSLLGSCKECGVNPREWLNDVISKLPYYLTPKSEKKLTELLPDRWGGYRQSHDTLPTVTGMSMDNPRTVHRQTVHAT